MASELNELAGQCSFDNPISLVIEQNQLIAHTKNESEIIYTFSETLSPESENNFAVDSKKLIVSYVSSPINFECNFTSTREPMHYIPMNPSVEIQGTESWCNAYVVAAVARSLSFSSCRARTVMSYFTEVIPLPAKPF